MASNSKRTYNIRTNKDAPNKANRKKELDRIQNNAETLRKLEKAQQ